MTRAVNASSIQSWFAMGCILALNLRWFVPAEDSADGATTWLSAFWCVAAVIATLFPFANDAVSRKWTRADAAVGLLIGGHLLSGFLVLVNGGNRHTAALLVAEWLGVAATWSIIRNLVRVPGFRAAVWQSTLLAIIAIAAVGCWQHWIELPSMAHRLGPKFDAARAGSDVAKQELSREGVPVTDPEFTLFEKRLRDSREPFAFFALANTLGGFLAAGLMLLIADRLCATGSANALPSPEIATNFREKTPAEPVAHSGVWATISAAVIVGLCLLLTKSRTALLAAVLMGSAVVVTRLFGSQLRMLLSKRTAALAIAGGFSVAVLFAVLSRSGSWDREVLTEAAKSLSYRVYYWTGTATLIAEHPILGGGLGQFRNAYLRVKAPAASEEIADPHNLLLDVWFHGGLLAAAGALWLAATLMMTIWKVSRPQSVTAESDRSAELRLLLAGAAAPLVVFAIQYIVHGAWDDRLTVVGLALMAVAYLIDRGVLSLPVPSRLDCGLAALVMFTHLLGAGGIGYTAVVQFLLLCLAGTFSPAIDEPTPIMRPAAKWISRGIFAAATVIVILFWRPDLRGLLEAADQLVTKEAPAEAIRASYTNAMQADRWNPLPCVRLAEFEFQQWQADRSNSRSDASSIPSMLSPALKAMNEAIRRDPENGRWYYRLGSMLQEWQEKSKSPLAAKLTFGAYVDALEHYPTNSTWQATLSDSASTLGDLAEDSDLAANYQSIARTAAQTAISQDDVNQRFGHVERILAAEIRTRLEQRCAVSPSN